MNFQRGMPLIPFLFPINLYLIGGSIGAGVQFPPVRIVESYLGWSVIWIWQELLLALNGALTGRTSLSVLCWVGGVLLLAAAAALLISDRGYAKRGVQVYGVGCVLLVVSTMIQYGPFFNGPAGVCIPIGLPLLAVIGYFLWKDAIQPDTGEDDDIDEPDDAPFATSPASPISADPIADD